VADDIKTEIKAKRTSKNSVFLDLFQDKNYLLKMYQTLHPEDTDTTQDELDIVTITNVLTDNLYNDLGVLVGDDKLLLLIEAQSTWTTTDLTPFYKMKRLVGPMQRFYERSEVRIYC
jgi:hypothetical protein